MDWVPVIIVLSSFGDWIRAIDGNIAGTTWGWFLGGITAIAVWVVGFLIKSRLHINDLSARLRRLEEAHLNKGDLALLEHKIDSLRRMRQEDISAFENRLDAATKHICAINQGFKDSIDRMDKKVESLVTAMLNGRK